VLTAVLLRMPRGATTYPDLRVTYTRALWDAALKQTGSAWRERNRKPLVEALVSVALSGIDHCGASGRRVIGEPLHHVSQAKQLYGVRDKIGGKWLTKKENRQGLGRADKRGLLPSGDGKRYASAAEAFLVGLLQFREDPAGGEQIVCAEELRELVSSLIEDSIDGERARTIRTAVDWHGGGKVICVAWEQLSPLLRGGGSIPGGKPLVKKHTRKALPSGHAYSLTAEGVELAQRYARREDLQLPAPAFLEARVVEGLILLVDRREGGHKGTGAGNLLKKCFELRRHGVEVETATLPEGFGDYLFVWRRRIPTDADADGDDDGIGVDYLIPHLIERKSAEDLAQSFRDGRWDSQQAAMSAMASTIDSLRENVGCTVPACEKEYVIQGKMEMLACKCGCRGFGGCCNPQRASYQSQSQSQSQSQMDWDSFSSNGDEEEEEEDDDGSSAPPPVPVAGRWVSFDTARTEVDQLPSRGYSVKQLTASNPDLARYLSQLRERWLQQLKQGGGGGTAMAASPPPPLLRVRQQIDGPCGRSWKVTLVAGATATTQEDLWSPSAEDVAGQLDAAIASSPSAASSPVHAAVGRDNADQRGGQAAGGALTSPLTSPAGSVGGASPPASVSSQRKSPSNRKKLTQAQMVEALQRRGDWPTKSCQCCKGSKSCRGGPTDELLSRLQSNLPQEIARRHASNTSDGRPGPIPRDLKTLEFGLLVMLDQETRRIAAQGPDRAVEFTIDELVDLAENAFKAGLTRVSPHISNGVGHAIYDGVHSIKAMAKFGENRSSDFDTTTLLEIHHRRAPSTYRLSQDGKRLAAACHLLAHDATRVGPAAVCTCGRPPPPDPNADFANYFVDDEEGRQFNPDGKRKDASTAAAAAAVDDDGVATVTTLAAAPATQCAATVKHASATQCNATKKHQHRLLPDSSSDDDSDDGWDVQQDASSDAAADKGDCAAASDSDADSHNDSDGSSLTSVSQVADSMQARLCQAQQMLDDGDDGAVVAAGGSAGDDDDDNESGGGTLQSWSGSSTISPSSNPVMGATAAAAAATQRGTSTKRPHVLLTDLSSSDDETGSPSGISSTVTSTRAPATAAAAAGCHSCDSVSPRRQRCKWGHDCKASGYRNVRERTDHFRRYAHPQDLDWVDDRPQKKKLRRENAINHYHDASAVYANQPADAALHPDDAQGTRRGTAQSARRTSVSIDLT
jgi:hypothetical protein